MKKNIVIAITIVFCFVLQSTLFNVLSFGGISPNLLIIITSAFGFIQGRKCGLLVGFFSGLLIDIFYGDVLCFYALVYMYIGYVNGIFKSIFYKEDIKLPLALILTSDLCYGILVYILLFLLRSRFNLGYYFIHIILPEIVYTILVTIILYPLILAISNKFDKGEQRSETNIV